jgi:hypothetical protein
MLHLGVFIVKDEREDLAGEGFEAVLIVGLIWGGKAVGLEGVSKVTKRP